MTTGADAQRYLADLSKSIRPLGLAVHDLMVAAGCSSYVKTIYVGYEIEGEMVAALYGHPEHIEIALALSEDAEGALLVDAGHLTWRSLPVAAIVRTQADLAQFEPLAKNAVERILTATHDVKRDNEFFVRRRRIVDG